mmetsp:Transcript_41403/g.81132  ORF Transcript_41403/g.81132 Transcript_41403/m.81132 type:complete len:150 (+) Transcript_41403:1359-1808(+)
MFVSNVLVKSVTDVLNDITMRNFFLLDGGRELFSVLFEEMRLCPPILYEESDVLSGLNSRIFLSLYCGRKSWEGNVEDSCFQTDTKINVNTSRTTYLFLEIRRMIPIGIIVQRSCEKNLEYTNYFYEDKMARIAIKKVSLISKDINPLR